MGYMRTLVRRHRALNGWKNPQVLEPFNNEAEDDRYLHPTKGYRTLSVKRTRMAVLTAEMKHGRVPWSMSFMKRELEMI